MKKKIALFTIISCLVSLIPMFVGLILWDKLPEQMATSFGFDGTVNGYSSRLFAVVGLPMILVCVNVFFIIATMADPRRKNISDMVLALVLSIIPACSLFGGVIMYQEHLGYSISAQILAPLFLGIMFVVLGSILPKCKQNYTVGIKLPWTLNSEKNWDKTHAFGGRVWTIGGIVMIVLGLLGFEIAAFATIFILVLIPTVYSYVYYRRYERCNKNS